MGIHHISMTKTRYLHKEISLVFSTFSHLTFLRVGYYKIFFSSCHNGEQREVA